MADDSSAQSMWPIPEFHFRVEWGSQVMSFQEVSGLDIAQQPMEYRAGDDVQFSTTKMPGLQLHGNITLKGGVFLGDGNFLDWFEQIKLNKIKRAPVKISLCDENSTAIMVWILENAWPTKLTGTELELDGKAIGIESIEIAHEGLTISHS